MARMTTHELEYYVVEYLGINKKARKLNDYEIMKLHKLVYYRMWNLKNKLRHKRKAEL